MRTVVITYIIAALSILCIASCADADTRHRNYEYIAHAGGAIDGYAYTNSKEALEQSVANGYKYVEFDLLMTADSVLVAAHTWSEFNAMTGYACKKDTAPTLSEFLSRRIYGKYSPLTACDINDFFAANKNLYLVTDKISDADVLEQYFGDIKNRMVVEAFSYPHYEELLEQGYHRVLYSCMAHDMNEAVVKHLLLHTFHKGRRIEWITLHTSAFDNFLFKTIDFFGSYKAALFTVNDTADIPERYRKKVYMIYTDSLLP